MTKADTLPEMRDWVLERRKEREKGEECDMSLVRSYKICSSVLLEGRGAGRDPSSLTVRRKAGSSDHPRQR